ncbi:MAG: CcmD family protein [Mailhella sp.]|nr:CcmD family protein [Mailhella sp.]
MNATHWLMMANAVIWIGIGAYVAFLASAQRKTERRLAALENDDER